MEEILILATVISPIVLAFTNLVKGAFPKFQKHHIPLVALVLGLFIGWASQPFSDLELVVRLWAGALAGLSATGLFEVTKKHKTDTK